MIVDESWFVFDVNSGSLFLQRLGFFGDMALNRTTSSYEVWLDILNPEKMMNGEALMVLLEWTIYGFSGGKKLGLPASQKEEPVWGNEVVNDKLSTALDTCFSGQTVATLGITALSQQSRDIPYMRADLPKQHLTSIALQGLRFMTNDCIKGKAGFYMTLESFSNSRKCERMITKIKFPVPIHLLDHLIIPIHVRDSHWFPVHMDVKSRCMSFLDSSRAYSAADYPRQKMLLWKFYRMAWTAHANANAPAPSWIVHPARIT